MKINLELLVSDLAVRLREGLLDPHSPNLEDDLRAAIKLNEAGDVSWHTTNEFSDSQARAD